MYKRAYCYKTYFDYLNFLENNFKENNWYVINQETEDYVVMQHFDGNLLRLSKSKSKYVPNITFSDYFYTDQEYNRIKNLEELLNE